MSDKYQDLRDAIAAGPTPGPWRADTEGKPDSDMNHGVIAEINDLWIAAMYRSGTTTDGDDKTPEAEAEAAANAHYIAEANPDTIAALLADNDRLREALAAVTATLEWLAHGGCRATDGPIMSSADAVAMGKAALAALNGADNE